MLDKLWFINLIVEQPLYFQRDVDCVLILKIEDQDFDSCWSRFGHDLELGGSE